MINNIIGAYSANLLTQVEAKSYVQRVIEANIAATEAATDESNARSAEMMGLCDCCQCDCELGDTNPEVKLPATATEAKQKEDSKKEALSVEIAKLIKYFEL